MKRKSRNQRLHDKRDKIKTKKLLKKYPFLAPINWFTLTQLSVKQHKYKMGTVLDDMPEGWRKAFGIELAEDIKQELKQKNIKNYTVQQVKEKYGGLRWYDNYRLDCISKYERLSERTCVICGKPATKITTGWICPYCDKCINKYKNYNSYVSIEEWFKEEDE